MHVSRYIAPFSQQNLMSAMLETSTDTLSMKSPRPTQRIQHAAEVLARERFLDDLDAVLLRFLAAAVVRGDDGDALG